MSRCDSDSPQSVRSNRLEPSDSSYALQRPRYQRLFDWFGGIRPTLLLASLVSILFLLRLPSALVSRELNVDESLFLSQAMKFTVDPRPWIGADVTTSGPLNSYFLSLFLLLGFKATFVLIHLLAAILVCLHVVICYLTLKHLASNTSALFGSFLMTAFYGLSTRPDYLHYSGELLPTTFLMVSFYLFTLWLDIDPQSIQRWWLIFLCGLSLGVPPWCKLQAAPISVALGLFVMAAIWKANSSQTHSRQRQLGMCVFVSGIVLPTFVMLGILLGSHAMNDFWQSYIVNNLAFAGKLSPALMVENLALAFLISPLHQLLFVGIVLGLYASRVDTIGAFSGKQKWGFSGLVLYAAGAAFAMCRVKHFFPHHVIFLLAPATYLISWLPFQASRERTSTAGASHKILTASLAVHIIAALALYGAYAVRYVQMVETIRQLPEFRTVFAAGIPTADGPSEEVASDQIQIRPNGASLLIGPSPWVLEDSNESITNAIRVIQKSRPVRSLAIWGWRPGVYVLTGIVPDTRYADTAFVISPGPRQHFFRANFVKDLCSHPPDLFIDAVVPDAFPPWVNWSNNDGYESDPELREFIDSNYVVFAELALEKGAKPVRLFIHLKQN